MVQIVKMAYRDLIRNRRRSLLTLLAVALGVALLIVVAGMQKGELGSAMDNNIRLYTGHVQVRADSYEEEKLPLAWKDLLARPEEIAAQAQALREVRAATPLLWASGLLNTRKDSTGVRVVGIDCESPVHSLVRDGIVAGEFLSPGDRSGLLLGSSLATSLEVGVGDTVALLVSTSDGRPEQMLFTVRGLFNTGFTTFDEGNVFLSLSKAQALTRAGNRASTVWILLHNEEAADRVATALQGPGRSVVTWRKMNELVLQAAQLSAQYMVLVNLIILAVVAVLIANTLLMAVFERTREMGILAALGMKGRDLLLMFLGEAGILGAVGTLTGMGLGSLIVLYLARVGIHIGAIAETGGSGYTLGSTMYARLDWPAFGNLSVMSMIIILAASLYPAWMAAHLEPIDALRHQ